MSFKIGRNILIKATPMTYTSLLRVVKKSSTFTLSQHATRR